MTLTTVESVTDDALWPFPQELNSPAIPYNLKTAAHPVTDTVIRKYFRSNPELGRYHTATPAPFITHDEENGRPVPDHFKDPELWKLFTRDATFTHCLGWVNFIPQGCYIEKVDRPHILDYRQYPQKRFRQPVLQKLLHVPPAAENNDPATLYPRVGSTQQVETERQSSLFLMGSRSQYLLCSGHA